MDYMQIARHVIRFQQTSFDNWYTAASLAQDQTVSAMLEQAAWMPGDWFNAFHNWVGLLREERTRLKSFMDMGLDDLQKTILETAKAAQGE